MSETDLWVEGNVVNRSVVVVTGPTRYSVAQARLVDELVGAGFKNGGIAQDLAGVMATAGGNELTVVTVPAGFCSRLLCNSLQDSSGIVVWVGDGRRPGNLPPPAAFGLARVVIASSRFVPKFMATWREMLWPDERANRRWIQRVYGPGLKALIARATR